MDEIKKETDVEVAIKQDLERIKKENDDLQGEIDRKKRLIEEMRAQQMIEGRAYGRQEIKEKTQQEKDEEEAKTLLAPFK